MPGSFRLAPARVRPSAFDAMTQERLPIEPRRARRLLCAMQDTVREAAIRARDAALPGQLAGVADQTAADIIYRIDAVADEAIFDWLEQAWPRDLPVELVMEGLENRPGEACFPPGTPPENTVLKLLIDPIDGTRMIMHDKRSAWVLAALAPQRGPGTRLSDTFAAMTELPTTKAGCSDQISGLRGAGPDGIVCERLVFATGERRATGLLPSSEDTLEHGFASLVDLCARGRARHGALSEAFFTRAGLAGAGSPLVFSDQYISTGGQFYEILSGRDRMVADVRPALYAADNLDALACHPYDVAPALLLTEAGCILEDLAGKPFDCPVDTTSPVGWAAWANPRLAERYGGILRAALAAHLD